MFVNFMVIFVLRHLETLNLSPLHSQLKQPILSFKSPIECPCPHINLCTYRLLTTFLPLQFFKCKFEKFLMMVSTMCLYIKVAELNTLTDRKGITVEPLSNDHPHQRPSLSYDHISCDGLCFVFVYESLTSDHPSYTTTPM